MIPVDFQFFQQQVPIPDFVRGTKSKLWYCGFCGWQLHSAQHRQAPSEASAAWETRQLRRGHRRSAARGHVLLRSRRCRAGGAEDPGDRRPMAFLETIFEKSIWVIFSWDMSGGNSRKNVKLGERLGCVLGEMKSRRRKTMGTQPEYSHLATRSAAYQRAFEDWPWAKTERIAASNIHPLEDLSKLGMFTQSHGRYFDPHKEFRYLDIFGDFTIYINYTRTDRIDGWHQYINSYISNYIYNINQWPRKNCPHYQPVALMTTPRDPAGKSWVQAFWSPHKGGY